jgi:hypothetical protein
MKKKILFLCFILLSPACFSQQTQDKITLVCKGTDSGYKIDLKSGKKTEFNNSITQTYQISNGRYHDMVCKFSEKSIWCRDEGEGYVMGDSYLIRYYDITIDRYSGHIRDYTKEIMTFKGIKTELVKTIEGICKKVTEKKF